MGGNQLVALPEPDAPLDLEDALAVQLAVLALHQP
jgi:hypothetical protein